MDVAVPCQTPIELLLPVCLLLKVLMFEYCCSDQPIFSTKAHVFQIDPETKKKWLPVSTQAVTISFYHDVARNSYRIISFENNEVP